MKFAPASTFVSSVKAFEDSVSKAYDLSEVKRLYLPCYTPMETISPLLHTHGDYISLVTHPW